MELRLRFDYQNRLRFDYQHKRNLSLENQSGKTIWDSY